MSEAATLQTGDRVRVLASQGDLEEGNKGTVVAMRADGSSEVRMDGRHEDYLLVSGSFEKIEPLHLRSSTGAMERTRALYGVKYVRSGTPEELIEIKCHLRQMIDEGMTYMFMERFLKTYGYQPNMVRRAFFDLTGKTPQEVVNEPAIRPPGTIPQFNDGWGWAKDGKRLYFIMPMTTWYGIFCQENDMVRNEVERHTELLDAKEACEKLVKKLEVFNPPVKKVKDPVMDATQLYRQPQLFLKATVTEEFERLFNVMATIHSPSLRKGMIRSAFDAKRIDFPQYDNLIRQFGDAEAVVEQDALIDRLKDIERSEMDRPLQEDLAEKTPQDFFQREELEGKYVTVPADVIDAVTRYLVQSGGKLKDFSVKLKSLKYVPLEPTGKRSDSDEPDLMNAIVSVSVVMEALDKTGASPQNQKKIGMVFSVISDKVWTTDTFKGDDRTIYALSDEGLAKYFQKERSFARG
jgi:hypothetical protein